MTCTCTPRHIGAGVGKCSAGSMVKEKAWWKHVSACDQNLIFSAVLQYNKFDIRNMSACERKNTPNFSTTSEVFTQISKTTDFAQHPHMLWKLCDLLYIPFKPWWTSSSSTPKQTTNEQNIEARSTTYCTPAVLPQCRGHLVPKEKNNIIVSIHTKLYTAPKAAGRGMISLLKCHRRP